MYTAEFVTVDNPRQASPHVSHPSAVEHAAADEFQGVPRTYKGGRRLSGDESVGGVRDVDRALGVCRERSKIVKNVAKPNVQDTSILGTAS